MIVNPDLAEHIEYLEQFQENVFELVFGAGALERHCTSEVLDTLEEIMKEYRND